MADETDIRELIGRMSAAQRQGFHVTPSAMRVVLAALRLYLPAQMQVARKPADPHDDAPHMKPERRAERTSERVAAAKAVTFSGAAEKFISSNIKGGTTVCEMGDWRRGSPPNYQSLTFVRVRKNNNIRAG